MDELQAPSIQRTLKDLPASYQELISERYRRLLPVLLLLLRPSDIAERNRTWPGVKPDGKQATTYLSNQSAKLARQRLQRYCDEHGESAEELWELFRAYCQYSPIGLIEALPNQLPAIIPQPLQDLADFQRLGKHPRADAGIYIRQLLDQYANELGVPCLPTFVARYAWASDRKVERWFTGESSRTEHVAKTTRRLNRIGYYPHQCWLTRVVQLPFPCLLSRRHPLPIQPWLIWLHDAHTKELMGYRVCPYKPTPQDLALALRWSVWHFGASWWPSRGIPDTLVLIEPFRAASPDMRRALAYLHTSLQAIPANVGPPTASPGYVGWPENFSAWLHHLRQRAERLPSARLWTMADLSMLLLDYLEGTMLEGTAARTTPKYLQEQNCSLPWSTGIGAALLLSSAGVLQISSGLIKVWGIPYDLRASGVPDGTAVDVRYDPDDARQIHIVQGRAVVAQAPACAFEHRTDWYELVEDPALLNI